MRSRSEAIAEGAGVIKRWREDPVKFVREVLGAEPDDWQVEFLHAVAAGDRVAVRSGHGVGKSVVVAWLVIWYVMTHFPCKVAITGSNHDQLRATTWAEVGTWLRQMPPKLQEEWDYTTETLRLKTAPEDSFALVRTSSKERAQNLAGFHSENVLVLIDEASAVDDLILDVLRGALTTEGAKLVLTGNPTQRSGFFFNAFHQQREHFTTFHISAADSARVSRQWVEEQASLYGPDSNTFRVRVLGEFPSQDNDAVIPLDLIEAAVGRQVEPIDVAPIWGVDPARYGEDRTALAKRQGNVQMELCKHWQGKDTEEVAGLVVYEWITTPVELRPSHICVDVIGIGAGVFDRLKRHDAFSAMPNPPSLVPVNVAESSSVRMTREGGHYYRLRDQLWFEAKAWFEARDVCIQNDAALIGELAGPRYGFVGGQLRVESKDDMKSRKLRSPDLADAFIMTFAARQVAAGQRVGRAGRRVRVNVAYNELAF